MIASILKEVKKKPRRLNRMLLNRTIQNKMQNFKESISFPSGPNWVNPLMPWCIQLVNNEPMRHMCKAEISQCLGST